MTAHENQLKSHGLRVTDARLRVLEAFVLKSVALSQPDIMLLLPDTFDRVTVYRTLERFVQHGILHEIADFSGAIRYALCNNGCNRHNHRHDHLHLHCRICNATRCTDILLQQEVLPVGFLVEKTSLYMEGICSDCQSKQVQ